MTVTITDNTRTWEATEYKGDVLEEALKVQENNIKEAYEFVSKNFSELADHNKLVYKIVYKHNGTETTPKEHRLFTSKGHICYFLKGKRRYGTELTGRNLYRLEVTVPKKREMDKTFQSNCERVVKHLNVDHLWEDVKTNAEIMSIIGYEMSREYYRAYFGSSTDKMTFEDMYNKRQQDFLRVKDLLEKAGRNDLVKAYTESSKGTLTTEDHLRLPIHRKENVTKFLGERLIEPYHFAREFDCITNAKIKRMSFHKGSWYRQTTEKTLELIGKAIDNKEKFTITGDNGYDVTFEYNPDKNMAWYSEEYRGCGNGHYYLALNRTHAIYYEKD